MSTEIDDLKMRVASLEDEFRAVFGKAETIEPAPGSDAEHPPAGYRLAKVGEKRAHGFLYRFCKTWVPDYPPDKRVGEPYQESQLPIANPIPANEGDSRLAESVAIPVGWKAVPEGIHREIPVKIRRRIASGAGLGLLIYPDPSIPWGEGYEAILPSEATEGDEYWSVDRWWKSGGGRCHPSVPGYFAWRRRIPATTPTEPARDLSAEVERLEAELETTKRLLAESLVERDRLKNLHDARKVRIEGFRDVLRERLGDLV